MEKGVKLFLELVFLAICAIYPSCVFKVKLISPVKFSK